MNTESHEIFPVLIWLPDITAVGGTQAWAPEIGWTGSTGGFSNYFPQAWYQADAVEGYLKNGIDPEAKAYYEAGAIANFSGRGFPDITAHSLYPKYVTTNPFLIFSINGH